MTQCLRRIDQLDDARSTEREAVRQEPVQSFGDRPVDLDDVSLRPRRLTGVGETHLTPRSILGRFLRLPPPFEPKRDEEKRGADRDGRVRDVEHRKAVRADPEVEEIDHPLLETDAIPDAPRLCVSVKRKNSPSTGVCSYS